MRGLPPTTLLVMVVTAATQTTVEGLLVPPPLPPRCRQFSFEPPRTPSPHQSHRLPRGPTGAAHSRQLRAHHVDDGNNNTSNSTRTAEDRFCFLLEGELKAIRREITLLREDHQQATKSGFALESEVKMMRGEVTLLREELRRANKSMGPSFPSGAPDSPPSVGSSAREGSKWQIAPAAVIIASAREARRIVIDVFYDHAAEDSCWESFNAFMIRDPSSDGLKWIAEDKTKCIGKNVRAATYRLGELYLAVRKVTPSSAMKPNDDTAPLAVLHDLHQALLSYLDKRRVSTTMDPRATKVQSEERDALLGLLGKIECRLHKIQREMARLYGSD